MVTEALIDTPARTRRRPPVPARPTRPPNRRDARRPQPARTDVRYRFAGMLLATLTGQRSVTRMLGLASGEVYDKLWDLAERGTLRAPANARPASPKVLTCRHSQPAPGVLEVCAVVRAAGRSRALAFRLERGPDDRWRCTALEAG